MFHQTVHKMLALVNKDRDYQEFSVENIELAVAEIDSINALYNFAQKTLLNVYQVGSRWFSAMFALNLPIRLRV